jgi:hypothetical protein
VLRLITLLLVVANLLFFGFSRGWFDGMFGLSSIGDREPERVASQIRPGNITLMPMPRASAAATAARAGCFEAGPVASTDAASAEATLQATLPAGSWTDIADAGSTGVQHTYRVASADPALATRLAALRLGTSGQGFSPCATAPPR